MTRAQRKEFGQGIARKSCRQARPAQPKDITAAYQKLHIVLLDDLPPELLREIVGLCADDVYTGRATLLSLSVMNRYLRSATASRLFERIYLRDEPESLGDEILHNLRRLIHCDPQVLGSCSDPQSVSETPKLRGDRPCHTCRAIPLSIRS